MRLAVELYGVVVGHFDGKDSRTHDFIPTVDGIERFGTNSPALSVVLPMVKVPQRTHAQRRRNWFAELQPEGTLYDYMLTQAGLRRGDVPAFLARYGRDVAGAVQIWDVDDPTEPKVPGLVPVDEKQIRSLLDDPLATPLANEPVEGRSSLGGVQPKIVLVRTETGWARATGGYPTTHILKPELPDRPTLIFDEEYGARLARALRLAEYNTSIERFDGKSALVIERFDRVGGRRVHQEDFSQALGASGNQKYQEVGGIASLRRIAETLQRHAQRDDLETLARMVTLSVAVGNLDMHAKNVGLLHPQNADIRVAPAYDVVPQAHLAGGEGTLALSINGEYRHSLVTQADLVAEFKSWGLRSSDRHVDDALLELGSAAASHVPLAGASPRLQDDVARFIGNLVAGRAAGAM